MCCCFAAALAGGRAAEEEQEQEGQRRSSPALPLLLLRGPRCRCRRRRRRLPLRGVSRSLPRPPAWPMRGDQAFCRFFFFRKRRERGGLRDAILSSCLLNRRCFRPKEQQRKNALEERGGFPGPRARKRCAKSPLIVTFVPSSSSRNSREPLAQLGDARTGGGERGLPRRCQLRLLFFQSRDAFCGFFLGLFVFFCFHQGARPVTEVV